MEICRGKFRTLSNDVILMLKCKLLTHIDYQSSAFIFDFEIKLQAMIIYLFKVKDRICNTLNTLNLFKVSNYKTKALQTVVFLMCLLLTLTVIVDNNLVFLSTTLNI